MSDHTRRPRRTILQTLSALGIGAAATVTTASAADDSHPDASPARGRPPVDDAATGDGIDGSDLYVGVVDRIVDGDHVVLLLEDGEAVVDQLVLPAERFDGMEPDDVFLTAVIDGELRARRRLPSKPTDCHDDRFDRISEEL
ncbi:hypothetical protein C478_11740 [Natrinema thermotolerans DSM 11552]|uniref:hypothetical protein n=1 Tax=unclassified Natrinema TaxID=2622230 RepID=UPI0002B16BBA|nr:hypothetical protein C478_11740 [Natrinema thermotolerans DSM 11552]